MSNTLQIGLAVAGAAVLAGVAAHNVWQTRRSQPRQAQPVMEADPAETTPAEASLSSDEQALDTTTDATVAEHTPEVSAVDITQTMQIHLGSERRVVLDPLLDAMALITLDPGVEVKGEAALAAMPATRRVDNKPFAIEGHNVATGVWEFPQPQRAYDQFQCGVQLANRGGALNEIGFSEFTLKAQAFADSVNGTPDIPDMRNEVARAKELDQFANPLDARLSFVLRAKKAAWSPGYLLQTLAGYGFMPGVLPGRLVVPSSQEGAPPVLSLEYDSQAAMADNLEQSAVYEAVLTLEVPHVPREEQPFARMCQTAIELAQNMGGEITDGDGRRIRAETMDAIAGELEGLYDSLEEHGFPAGSMLARRLFS